MINSEPNGHRWRTPALGLHGVAAVLLSLFVAVAVFLALRRHETFHTYLLDLGYYTQVIWNTAHGQWFANSIKPPTFLADHFSPLLAALAPLFWLAPDARLLLIISIVAISTAIIPGYATLRRSDAVLAVLLVVCFVLNPMVHDVAAQEFHEIMLAVPLMAIAVYAVNRARYRLLLLSMLLLLLVREDMGIYVAAFGPYVLVKDRRRWRLGSFLICLGIGWLLLMTAYVMPALGGGAYRHTVQFSDVGGSASNVLQTAVTDPVKVVQVLLSTAKLQALVRVFAPLAILPLLAVSEIVLWLPAVLFLLMSSAAIAGSLSGWYVAPLLPILWMSIALAVGRLAARQARLAMAALILASVVGFLLWSPFPGGQAFVPAAYAVDQHMQIGHDMLATIPAGEALATQNGLGAHVAARQQLYLFPWFDWNNPPSAIMLDEKAPTTYPLTANELQTAIRQLQMEPAVQTKSEGDGYYVFSILPAVSFPRQSPLTWPAGLRLDGYEVAQTGASGAFTDDVSPPIPGQTLRVMLYLTALEKMDRDLAISVRLVDANGRLLAQDDNWPARGLLPTTQWTPGRLIRDTHYLEIPAAAAASPLSLPISLVVLVYDSATSQPVEPAAGYTLTSWPAP